MSKNAILHFSFTSLFCLMTCQLSWAEAPNLVGTRYTGTSPVAGCKEEAFDTVMFPQTGLMRASGTCKGSLMFWLNKVEGGTISETEGKKTVVDQVIVRKLKKDEKFSLSELCYFKGHDDKPIAFPAIFKGWKNEGPMTAKNGYVVEGWLINEKSAKLQRQRLLI